MTPHSNSKSYPSFVRSLALIGLFLTSSMLVAEPASAGVMSLGVDSADSSFSAHLSFSASLLGSSFDQDSLSVNFHAIGAAPPINTTPPAQTGFLGNLAIAGSGPGTPGALLSEGGGFYAFQASLPIHGPTIPNVGPGSVTLSLMAPLFSLPAGGTFNPLSSSPGSATYDFSNLPIKIAGGTFGWASTGYLGFLGNGSQNFFTNLASATLPSGTHGTLTLGIGPATHQPVTLSIPMSMDVPLFHFGNSLLGATVDAVITGTLVLNGYIANTVIPEPGSIILLGIGLVAGLPLTLRRLRRRAT